MYICSKVLWQYFKILENKYFSCFKLSDVVFILLINVKMTGIVTFMSMLNLMFKQIVNLSMYTGMRKFRIDQDFLIEHWHMIYIMSVVFAEIYV